MKKRVAKVLRSPAESVIAEVASPPTEEPSCAPQRGSKCCPHPNNEDFQVELEEDLFTFVQIPNFDARKGYRACKSPGVGVDGKADVSLWRDAGGNVVARFSSQGYRFSFVVYQDHESVCDDQMEALESYLSELAFWWLIEGVDDTPDTELWRLNRTSPAGRCKSAV